MNVKSIDEFVNGICDKSLKNIKSMIIYGDNNSGKTYLLKSIYDKMNQSNVKVLFNQNNGIINNKIVIPTIFISVDRIKKEDKKQNDIVMPIIDSTYYSSKIENYDFEYSSFQIRKFVENNYFYIIEEGINYIFDNKVSYKSEEFEKYSDGVKNTVNIISYLTYFYKINEYNFEGDAKSSIVLVDEIESFMHIKSQINLVNYIKRIFCKTIFIFTSHSPVLIQRLNKFEIYKIQSGYKISKIEKNLYFEGMDTLFNAYFDLDHPVEVERLLQYLDKCKKNIRAFDKDEYKIKVRTIRNEYPNYNLVLNEILLDFFCEMEMIHKDEWRKLANDFYKKKKSSAKI